MKWNNLSQQSKVFPMWSTIWILFSLVHLCMLLQIMQLHILLRQSAPTNLNTVGLFRLYYSFLNFRQASSIFHQLPRDFINLIVPLFQEFHQNTSSLHLTSYLTEKCSCHFKICGRFHFSFHYFFIRTCCECLEIQTVIVATFHTLTVIIVGRCYLDLHLSYVLVALLIGLF